MQSSLLHLSVYNHGFTVPVMLDTGTMRLFVSQKLAAKLPAMVQTTMLLTVTLPMGKTMFAT